MAITRQIVSVMSVLLFTATAATANSSIVGRWNAPPILYNDDPDHSLSLSWQFSDDQKCWFGFSYKQIFTDQVSIAYTLRHLCSYQDHGDGRLDYTFEASFLAINSEYWVAHANNTSLCGISDWVRHQEREVTHADCGHSAPYGERILDRYLLTDDRRVLYVGPKTAPVADEVPVDAEGRPLTVWKKIHYNLKSE
jgi:hypothetical protein